mmetsp:Transcript_32916/g.95308  ORF Transcript_32916/g.95308 Transcript_32916/m.95308 type:complete len:240 (+) Transcript_32916:281-1000(+)
MVWEALPARSRAAVLRGRGRRSLSWSTRRPCPRSHRFRRRPRPMRSLTKQTTLHLAMAPWRTLWGPTWSEERILRQRTMGKGPVRPLFGPSWRPPARRFLRGLLTSWCVSHKLIRGGRPPRWHTTPCPARGPSKPSPRRPPTSSFRPLTGTCTSGTVTSRSTSPPFTSNSTTSRWRLSASTSSRGTTTGPSTSSGRCSPSSPKKRRPTKSTRKTPTWTTPRTHLQWPRASRVARMRPGP